MILTFFSFQLFIIGNLCNNAYVSEDGKYIGQPTDIALLEVSIRSGIKDEREVNIVVLLREKQHRQKVKKVAHARIFMCGCRVLSVLRNFLSSRIKNS